MLMQNFTGIHKLTLSNGPTLKFTMHDLGRQPAEPLEDGFYEVMRDDCTLMFFRVRKGVRRELTEAQMRAQIAGAAAWDRKTGKLDRTKLTMAPRIDANVRRAVLKDLGHLEGSVNGVECYVTIVPDGSEIKAWSDRFKAGEYGGSHKGYAIMGKEHHVEATVSGYLHALRAFGDSVIDHQMIALDAQFIEEIGPDASIYLATCVLGNHRGDRIVERGVAVLPGGIVWTANTVRGAKSMVQAEARRIERKRLDELDRQRAAEIAEMERPMREAEAAAIERDRQQRAAADDERRRSRPIPDRDMDAVAGLGL